MKWALTMWLILMLAGVASANHGPGASGGGSSTVSGETLKEGRFELSLREDFTQFEHFSQSAAQQRAIRGGEFDALDHGFVASAQLAYGITNDLEIGASLGYFIGHDFVGAGFVDGTVESSTTNPDGLTDLTLMAKYRVMRGRPGNLAVVAGVIVPVGRSNVALASGERLSPTDQPGTGRWGFVTGVGYSRFLTSHLTIDASVMYTFRFEKDEFKVGDRFDLGLALAYRLTESIQTFPQVSVFLELNDVYLFKDRAGGASDPNSGGNALYLTPGLRVRLSRDVAVTVAPSFPVWQEVNGDQGKVEYKVGVMLSVGF